MWRNEKWNKKREKKENDINIIIQWNSDNDRRKRKHSNVNNDADIMLFNVSSAFLIMKMAVYKLMA